MTRRRVVVVGVDGGYDGLRATDYGARLAVEQGRALRLIYAYHTSIALTPMLPAYGVQEMRDYGVEALEQAERRARAIDGDLVVDHFLVQSSPARALVHASSFASAVILGRRRIHGVERVLAGSTSTAVAARAKAPVISVPGLWKRADDARRVVVGTDGSQRGHDALAFAFAEASRRGAPLMVVRVWEYPARWYSDLPAMDEELDAWFDAARLALAEDLAGWSEEYPEVQVSRVVEHSVSAVKTLVGRSEGASLLVVGARGHGGLPGLDLGWTSRSVLAHASVPVAVVHQGDAAVLEPELIVPSRLAAT